MSFCHVVDDRSVVDDEDDARAKFRCAGEHGVFEEDASLGAIEVSHEDEDVDDYAEDGHSENSKEEGVEPSHFTKEWNLLKLVKFDHHEVIIWTFLSIHVII